MGRADADADEADDLLAVAGAAAAGAVGEVRGEDEHDGDERGAEEVSEGG